jgi:hypothetical protein
MYFTLNGYEIVPEAIKVKEFAVRTPIDRQQERGWYDGATPEIEGKKVEGRITDGDHARTFLDCVKKRQQPVCNIEFGHRCTSAALIGNIAHKTRSLLEWNSKTEQFTNNEKANALLKSNYRKPYELPTG